MEFRVLGPLEVLENGAKLELGHAKQRAVLGVLLLHRREVVSTERLIDELWGESPPATATKTIQVYVSHLRKALGAGSESLLRTQPPGYVLEPEGAAVDADGFESLVAKARQLRSRGDLETAADRYREALALWRGRALADLLFESFAANEAERLNELRVEALTERIDCDLELGRHAELVGELEVVVAEHPLREPFRRQLMLALYRSGRQADALEAYHDARRTLREELGLEPSRELRRLEQRILRQDESLQTIDRDGDAGSTAVRKRRRLRTISVGALAAAALLTLAAIAAARHVSHRRLLQPDSVGVIDPDKGRVVADIAVGADPASIATADGSVWVGNATDRTVSRVDARAKRRLRTIPVDMAPRFLATSKAGVWADSGSAAVRIAPTFNTAAAAVRLASQKSPGETLDSAAVRSGLWIPAGDGVARIDPRTGRPVDAVLTGTDGPVAVATGAGAVWAAQQVDKAVIRIDRTRTLTPVRLTAPPMDVAVGAGAVWAVTTDGMLVRIDPSAAAVVTTIPVGARPSAVAVGGGYVWVANALDGTISQIDPRQNRLVRTIVVGNSPQALGWADGRLWVAVQARASSVPAPRAGATLRIESELTDFEGLDPALNYTTYGSQFDYATCLRLVNYADASAPAPAQLVPEAATTLGAVSPDGRRYTFTIRKGFRFSPPSGEPVTAETFRYAIERALNPRMKSYAGYLFADIVGFSAFEAGKTKHVAGVTVHGDRLSIRLVRQSPDLRRRLATQFFCAVPIGTPVDPRGVREIPSAGPYYVASERPEQVVLKRNPNYGGNRPHTWARIVLTTGISRKRIMADVEAGRADFALDGVPRAAIPRLIARYGPATSAAASGRQQYFDDASTIVQYLALNTQRPLFRHLRLRQAVNYAVDRTTLASLGAPTSDPAFSGPQIPTDHYLLPGIPGYREAHAYPLHPDLARATKLARGLGGRAVMLTCEFDVCRQIARTVHANVEAIGIDVVVKRLPIGELYAREAAGRFDIATAGWGFDYADPANILLPLFDGRSVASGSNFSRFDERVWNHRLRAAAQLSGRARAHEFAKLDLALAREAAPAVAWSYETRGDFFAPRVGCQIEQPSTYGIDLATLCIRR